MSPSTPSRAPRPPAVWPVFLACAVVLLLTALGSLVLVAVVTATRAPGSDVGQQTARFLQSPPGVLSLTAVTQASFLAVAILTAKLLGGHPIAALRLGASHASPVGYVAAIIGTSALSLASGSAAELAGLRNEGGTMQALTSSLSHARPATFAMAILILAIGPGIAEESFFRGLVQTRIGLRWGRGWGIWISAALFGLVHVDRLQSPLAFILGLYLGLCAETLGGIRPSTGRSRRQQCDFRRGGVARRLGRAPQRSRAERRSDRSGQRFLRWVRLAPPIEARASHALRVFR